VPSEAPPGASAVSGAELAASADAPSPTAALLAGQRVDFQADVRGTETYECRGSEAEPARWVWQNSEAELVDASGQPAGKEAAGHGWDAVDGSHVDGELVHSETPDPRALPWLLLRATSHAGTGRLSGVTFIQRRDTSGGLPPQDGCDAAHSGESARIPYTAVYYFYAPDSGR
jgi:hypothetical protein